MPTPPDYPKLVDQAEKAVASVKDPELKRIAFQKVLDDLLQSSLPTEARGAKPKSTPRSKAKPTRKAKGGPKVYLDELVADEFFKKPKTITQVKAELENRGHHIPTTSLSGPLQRLCQQKILRRQKTKDSSNTFAYSDS
jgi:hypothetical protein